MANDIYTPTAFRSIKRADGLRLKHLREFTFYGMLEAILARFSSLTAYSVYGDKGEKSLTYEELGKRATSMATFLLDSGFEKGDRVAILSESCPNWMCAYMGGAIVGIVSVPILPDFSQKEVEEILKESGAKAVVVNAKQKRKVSAYAEEHSLLVINMDDLTVEGIGLSIAQVEARGTLLASHRPQEDDLASIIFTSGTTGSSKGVMLTHKNLLVCADEATDVYVKLRPGYKALSILPMSHTYEFALGHLLTLLQGMEVVFLGKPPATTILMAALSEVRPHIILTVPLLMEKVYKAAVAPAITGDGLVAKLYKSKATRWIVYWAVGAKLKRKFGGRLRFYGIGGAPLDKEVEEFLWHTSFPYAIGYGLTETAPLIAGVGPQKHKHVLHHIGAIVSHDDVILLDRNSEGVGEIAVKGPNVMKGYYHRDDLNREVFTEDGYFKTGDLGSFDKEGNLAIRGRVKTMILGPGGENIYPENIESLLNNMEYVEESLVIPSDGGLAALVKLDLESIRKKFKDDREEARKFAAAYIETLKARVNKDLSAFSRIAEARLQEKPFERTPTLKIKRFLYQK